MLEQPRQLGPGVYSPKFNPIYQRNVVAPKPPTPVRVRNTPSLTSNVFNNFVEPPRPSLRKITVQDSNIFGHPQGQVPMTRSKSMQGLRKSNGSLTSQVFSDHTVEITRKSRSSSHHPKDQGVFYDNRPVTNPVRNSGKGGIINSPNYKSTVFNSKPLKTAPLMNSRNSHSYSDVFNRQYQPMPKPVFSKKEGEFSHKFSQFTHSPLKQETKFKSNITANPNKHLDHDIFFNSGVIRSDEHSKPSGVGKVPGTKDNNPFNPTTDSFADKRIGKRMHIPEMQFVKEGNDIFLSKYLPQKQVHFGKKIGKKPKDHMPIELPLPKTEYHDIRPSYGSSPAKMAQENRKSFLAFAAKELKEKPRDFSDIKYTQEKGNAADLMYGKQRAQSPLFNKKQTSHVNVSSKVHRNVKATKKSQVENHRIALNALRTANAVDVATLRYNGRNSDIFSPPPSTSAGGYLD